LILNSVRSTSELVTLVPEGSSEIGADES